MEDKNIIRYGEEEFINANYTQDIIDIEKSFKNDILYKMLKRAGLTDKIVTEEMIKSLFIGRTYKTEEVAIMTGVAEPTLRNLLNGRDASQLPSYINAIKETKFHILDAESIYRVRLIYLVQKELKHSIKQISEIATGMVEPYNKSRVIYPPEQINYISDKLDKLEINNNELNDKCEQLSKQNVILLNFIQNICEKDENDQLKLKTSAMPLLESNKEIEEIKDKLNKLENNSQVIIKKEVNEHFQKFDNDISLVKRNMLYRKAENIALERRTFKERLFNKMPDKTTVDEIFDILNNNENNS
jgi:transcriptional regulator with XRE-family HTH domain